MIDNFIVQCGLVSTISYYTFCTLLFGMHNWVSLCMLPRYVGSFHLPSECTDDDVSAHAHYCRHGHSRAVMLCMEKEMLSWQSGCTIQKMHPHQSTGLARGVLIFCGFASYCCSKIPQTRPHICMVSTICAETLGDGTEDRVAYVLSEGFSEG
jgi:hypothetical protein